MHRNINRAAIALAAIAALAISSAASAQDAAADPMATAAAAAAENDAIPQGHAKANAQPCVVKKKKKGIGLGGILKAAKKTGLTNMVAGGVLGQTGVVANAVAGTAVEIGTASAAQSPQPAVSTPAC